MSATETRAPGDGAVLRAEGLVKRYESAAEAVEATAGVSLSVRHGELVLIMGPSGAGKTTLLLLCGALLRPTAGHIWIDGTDVTELGERQLPDLRLRRLGFVFQSANLLEHLTAAENVRIVLEAAGRRRDDAAARARDLLADLGLEQRGDHLPAQLSGGERQRVAIARALANEPGLVLADEPTGALDSRTGAEVMSRLRALVDERCTAVLCVTHDPRIVDLADRVLWLEDGRLEESRPASPVAAAPAMAAPSPAPPPAAPPSPAPPPAAAPVPAATTAAPPVQAPAPAPSAAAPAPGGIEDVLAEMRTLLERFERRDDHRRHFCATYLRTTEAIADAVTAGAFVDGPWVEAWDVAFAQLYLDALGSWEADRTAPAPWAVAFGPDEGERVPPLRHVLLGINAHINCDLPQALLATITDAQFDDPQLLARRHEDHRRIDGILASRVDAEDEELKKVEQPGDRTTLDRLLEPFNRRATQRFLAEAREKVWRNAQLLSAARRDGTLASRIAELEALAAQRVADLRRPGQVILRLARRGFGVELSHPPAPPGEGDAPPDQTRSSGASA